jgi:hypothetical protein
VVLVIAGVEQYRLPDSRIFRWEGAQKVHVRIGSPPIIVPRSVDIDMFVNIDFKVRHGPD